MPFTLTLPSEIHTLENSQCPKERAYNVITGSGVDITTNGSTTLDFSTDLVTGQIYSGIKVQGNIEMYKSSAVDYRPLTEADTMTSEEKSLTFEVVTMETAEYLNLTLTLVEEGANKLVLSQTSTSSEYIW